MAPTAETPAWPLAEPPLFVVAAPRSGTTLLRSLLSAHSRIAVTPETHFLKIAEMWDGSGANAPADAGAFWEALRAHERFVDLDVPVARAQALAPDESYRGIFAGLLAAYAERTGKPRVGEKTPLHIEFLDRLRAWFPAAPIFVMARDPRATVASHMSVPWVERMMAERPSDLSKGIWGLRRYQIARLAAYWSRMYGARLERQAEDPRVLVVRYEDLVADTDAVLRTACAFLNERFEPAMARRRESVPPPATGDAAQASDQHAWRKRNHVESLKPIAADRAEKWRRQLSEAEVAVIEGVCEDAMTRLGYAPECGEAARRAGVAQALALRSGLRAQDGLRRVVHGLRTVRAGGT